MTTSECELMGSVERAQLQEWKTQKTKVRIIITNGFQLTGYIKAYDQNVILIVANKKEGTRTQMLYKSAISTIEPNAGSSSVRD